MSNDRPLLGILLMLGFCALAPLGDSMAKILGDRIPVLQLVAVRFAVQFAILLPLIFALRLPLAMSSRALWLTALRTVLHVTGIAMMFLALQHLPLADAIAIAFVMPFILLLLGRFLLNEEVGARRLIACAVGFAGTLMVVQPSFVEVGAPALLPLGVAVTFSLFMLVTRQIAREVDPIALQTVSGAMASVVLLPLLLILNGSGIDGLDAVWPSMGDWTLLFLLGALGTVAHLMMTWSLRYAPAATLAPMQYLEIPFATLIGWLIFRDFPDGLALAGIVVTMAAGLYIIYQERVSARLSPPAAPPAAE